MATQRRNDVPPSLNNTLSTTMQRHDAHRLWYDIALMQCDLLVPNGVFFPYNLDESFEIYGVSALVHFHYLYLFI